MRSGGISSKQSVNMNFGSKKVILLSNESQPNSPKDTNVQMIDGDSGSDKESNYTNTSIFLNNNM